jgi:membrane protease YdiL (CAAX protease family)
LESDPRHLRAPPVEPKAERGGGPPRRRAPLGLVPTALLFYGAMLGAALLWSWLSGDALLYASPAAARAGVDWNRDVTAGAASAIAMILISQQLTRRTRWGERMGRFLGRLLGRLDWRRCLLLAVVSGIAEEALFRGALQPRVGLVAASLIFGLAHFAPLRDLLPWTLLSIAAGFALGALFDATGNLVAPVVAHAGVNAVNLRFVSERYAPR